MFCGVSGLMEWGDGGAQPGGRWNGWLMHQLARKYDRCLLEERGEGSEPWQDP